MTFLKIIFAYAKRDPVTNASSILDARKRQHGNEGEWYSFKIPEYPQLKGLDPVSQSAGQVHYINAAVTKGIEKIAESRKLVIEYESFCRNPHNTFNKLVHKLGINTSDYSYTGPEKFTVSRSVDNSSRDLIEKAISFFE